MGVLLCQWADIGTCLRMEVGFGHYCRQPTARYLRWINDMGKQLLSYL